MATFALDPSVVFLNHGSFGACPREVLAEQARLRAQLEAQPVRFFMRELSELEAAARSAIAAFVGAKPENLARVPNATAAVNAVVRGLALEPGDELLCTDHGYNACTNVLRYVAERSGAKLVTAQVPFPLEGPEQVLEAVLAAVTPRTRFALLDHLTSPTALVFPIAQLVKALRARGVETMVDGAHAPGQVPLDVEAIGAGWYTGNLHKWVCGPKSSAFLHVREDLQGETVPASVSHGFNAPQGTGSRFRNLFDWTGTDDPTAWLSAPKALEVVGALSPRGWAGVMEANHALAVQGRTLAAQALGVTAPCPPELLGAMATLVLPGTHPASGALPGRRGFDPLQEALFQRHHVELPVFPWPASPRRVLRLSAHQHNRLADYERLAAALREEAALA